MQTPLQLTFRGLAHSDALAAHIEQRAQKLEHLFERIISCHVVVELDGHHHRHGNRYRVSINMGLPGQEVLVDCVPQEPRDLPNAHATADKAFDEVERQLRDWVRRHRVQRHQAAL